MKTAFYRRFETQDALDLEYDPVRHQDGSDSYAKRWGLLTSRLNGERTGYETLAYGQRVEETIRMYPRYRNVRGCVAILDSRSWGERMLSMDPVCLVPGFHRAGFDVALISHGLAPSAHLRDVVRQVRSAIAFLMRRRDASSRNGPLFVFGQGAAAHLASMCYDTAWKNEYGVDGSNIARIFMVSGIYDLYPLRYSWLQPSLQLSSTACQTLSPTEHPVTSFAPSQIIVGQAESAEFRRQSLIWYHHLARRRAPAQWLEIEQAHHFSLLEMIREDPESILDLHAEETARPVAMPMRLVSEV